MIWLPLLLMTVSNTKAPLKTLKFYTKAFAVVQCLLMQTLAVADVRIDMLLKGDSDIHFTLFDSAVGLDMAKERESLPAYDAPAPRRSEGYLSEAGLVDTTYAIDRHKVIEGPSIYHRNLNAQMVDGSNGACVFHHLVDGDAAFSVKDSSEVNVVFEHQGLDIISGELGGHPMPGSEMSAEGQYRTKQAERLGVCREQGPDPKGKVCSELTGNRENETETISSCVENTTQGNRLAYQKTCNVPVRFVRPGGQGGTADVTWEAREYTGRPWYWDRQCPAGRAYMLRKDDVFFMVDPRFLFKWTGDLTYPDQMAFTRLCGLRFFMETNRRMFSAVVDGVTS